MVQPLLLRGLLAASLLPLAACQLFAPPPSADDPSDEAFVHRAYTWWAPLPSADGSRLAVVLEPRRVDADSHGVMIEGWHGQVTGDGVVTFAAGADPTPLAAVSRGFHDVDGDATTWFVWTEAAADWTPEAPNDPPPRARYRDVVLLDRATFATKGSRSFDPPLERPYGFGTTIVDTPRDGDSDVARDVRIATHDVLTGATAALYADRGYRVASCARAAGVTVAYEAEGTKQTMLVDVALDPLRVSSLAVGDLASFDVLCRAQASRVAVTGVRGSGGPPRTLLVAVGGTALSLVRELEATTPAALSTDGAALVATRADDSLARFGDAVTEPIGIGRPAGTPVVSGDRAVFATAEASFLVRLDAGAPAGATRLSAGKDQRDVSPAAPGAFVVLDQTYDDVSYGKALARAFYVDDGGEVDLPVDAAYEDPYFAYADRSRVYVVGERRDPNVWGSGDVEIQTIELATHAVAATARFPLCDPATIRASGRCAP